MSRWAEWRAASRFLNSLTIALRCLSSRLGSSLSSVSAFSIWCIFTPASAWSKDRERVVSSSWAACLRLPASSSCFLRFLISLEVPEPEVGWRKIATTSSLRWPRNAESALCNCSGSRALGKSYPISPQATDSSRTSRSRRPISTPSFSVGRPGFLRLCPYRSIGLWRLNRNCGNRFWV